MSKTETTREATCQQGEPCRDTDNCPDPIGCGFVNAAPETTPEVGECGRAAEAELPAESGSPSYADASQTTKKTPPLTAYALRLWETLEDVQAKVELPEELDDQVTAVLWSDTDD
jgi:hypothetical protein